MGVVLVLDTGRLSRQGGGLFGGFLLSDSFFTLQRRLGEAGPGGDHSPRCPSGTQMC